MNNPFFPFGNGTGFESFWNITFPLSNKTIIPKWNFTDIFTRPPIPEIDIERYKLILRLYRLHDRLYYTQATFAAVSLAFNLLLITIFMRMRKTQKARIPNIMFLFQAVSDLLLAVFLILSTLSTKLRQSEEANKLYITYTFFFEYTIFLSVNILLLATSERLLAIRFPLRHHTIVTPQKVLMAIFITFIISAIPAIVFVSCLKTAKEINVYYIVIAAVSLTEVFLIYLFLRMTYATIKKSISVRIQQRQATKRNIDPTVKIEKRKNIRVFRIVLVMCTIYAITFLPHIIMTFYFSALSISDYDDYVLLRTFELVYVSSSIINPVITILFKDDYRKIIVNLVKGKKPPSSNRSSQMMNRSISNSTTIGGETAGL